MDAGEIVASKAFDAFRRTLPLAPPRPSSWDELDPTVKAAWLEATRIAILTALELHAEGQL